MTTLAEISKGEGDMSDDELICMFDDMMNKLMEQRGISADQASDLLIQLVTIAYEDLTYPEEDDW